MPQLKSGPSPNRTEEWETPRWLFEELDGEFHFTLDACARPTNAKCRAYLTRQDDALSTLWIGSVFCNPPYGRDIGRWIRWAWISARNGAMVVLLVPASTDTGWWHDFCMRGEVRFIRSRLYFGPGEDKRSPFASAVVVFRPPLCI